MHKGWGRCRVSKSGSSLSQQNQGTFSLWHCSPRSEDTEEGVCYLSCTGAGVLAVQHEGDPASLHLPFEEMLLGNPNHLRQLPEEGEGLQTYQLTLLIPRGTSGLAAGSQAKPQPSSRDHSNALVSTELSGTVHHDSPSFLRVHVALKRPGMTLAREPTPRACIRVRMHAPCCLLSSSLHRRAESVCELQGVTGFSSS